MAYHLNDSITEIYYEIKNENLLYKRPDTCLAFYADIKVAYRLVSEPGSKKIFDSSSLVLLDRSTLEVVPAKSLRTKFKIKAPSGSVYSLVVESLDRNKKTNYTSTLLINKLTLFTAQSFLITHRDTVAFKNYFAPGETLLIRFNNPAINRITVDYFLKDYGPALPPFSIKPVDDSKFKPDSTFTLEPGTNQFMLTVPRRGFYHVKANPSGTEGLSVFSYESTFPGLGSSDEMVNSTRYIMERNEFESCKDAPEQKAAIDKFWLGIGSSNERARELLKRYYGRVLESNKFFTSYCQGWKSDRGMIYIVFGSPTNLYKSKKDEIWVYGNEANPAALRFVFNKTANPYSENDYSLERSQFYKEAWYGAVEYWRQGNIYQESRR